MGWEAIAFLSHREPLAPRAINAGVATRRSFASVVCGAVKNDKMCEKVLKIKIAWIKIKVVVAPIPPYNFVGK